MGVSVCELAGGFGGLGACCWDGQVVELNGFVGLDMSYGWLWWWSKLVNI